MADGWTRLEKWPVILLERLGDTGVARITLDRPHKRNALSVQLMDEFLAALELIRSDRTIQVAITRANGPAFSAGLDLHDLRSFHERPLEDWDLATPATRLYETVRTFPRIMIAQVHGYCLGGAVALVSSHDIAIAAANAEIGMPEILRGSFGQNVTAALWHAGIPVKKAAMLQLSGRNLSGVEADQIGIVSQSVDEPELEATTTQLASEIASRNPAALQHAKIATHLGRDLPLPHALEVDRLVTSRMRRAVDPLEDVNRYLTSQKGGTNVGYTRDEVAS